MTLKEIDDRICTIYLLTNTINKKVYVGQTWNDVEDRMGENGAKYSHSPYIYNAINKYGAEKFIYDILDICETQEEADKLETFYIEKYDAKDHNFGYNIKNGGSHGRHSEETKKKISESLKKVILSEQALINRNKIKDYWLGKKRVPFSEEQKKQKSEFFIQWHSENIHPMLGKHHTEEAKIKISTASTGRKIPRASVEAGAEKRRMKKEKEQNIIDAYINNMSIVEIENKFNTGRTSIYRIIKRNNLLFRVKKTTSFMLVAKLAV